jgi:Na+-transporting NADH:ubiquinone oxidoreductase subunit NqrC
MQENTPTPIDSEITQVLRQNSSNTWKTISFILGLILVAGTLLSTLGKSFYVTRTEYTEKDQRDAVTLSNLTQSVSSIKESIHDQTMAFKDLRESVDRFKFDVMRKGAE